jgi:hypothetical protein
VKIISGGQTGVDRAALDVALRHGIPCGGWCPAGRLDEFGTIPEHYPLQELNEGRSPDRPGGGVETAAPWSQHDSFTERTRRNVIDSDGTVIIYDRQLSGGTEETVRFCRELNRPHQLIDASSVRPEQAADMVRDLVTKHNIKVLNVAGPRQSEWPAGYDYATQTLERFLSSAD